MDMDGYPFTSTYLEVYLLFVLYGPFSWLREHAWASKVMRRYLHTTLIRRASVDRGGRGGSRCGASPAFSVHPRAMAARWRQPPEANCPVSRIGVPRIEGT